MPTTVLINISLYLFLHFYPQPELEDWYAEQKAMVMDTFSEATDTQVRLKADKIYLDLKSQFDHFSSEEQDFLKEMTADRASVKAFFTKFCQGNQQSPHFHRDNQIKVCSKIKHLASFF